MDIHGLFAQSDVGTGYALCQRRQGMSAIEARLARVDSHPPPTPRDRPHTGRAGAVPPRHGHVDGAPYMAAARSGSATRRVHGA